MAWYRPGSPWIAVFHRHAGPGAWVVPLNVQALLLFYRPLPLPLPRPAPPPSTWSQSCVALTPGLEVAANLRGVGGADPDLFAIDTHAVVYANAPVSHRVSHRIPGEPEGCVRPTARSLRA